MQMAWDTLKPSVEMQHMVEVLDQACEHYAHQCGETNVVAVEEPPAHNRNRQWRKLNLSMYVLVARWGNQEG